MADIKTQVTNKELRNFGLVFATGVLLIFGLFFPWILENPWPRWPWILAGAVSLPALVMPVLLSPVYKVWMKIGHALGWLNSRIILGIIFFIMFAPIGLMLRVFGKDFLRQKLDETATTYRIKSEILPRERMERPF